MKLRIVEIDPDQVFDYLINAFENDDTPVASFKELGIDFGTGQLLAQFRNEVYLENPLPKTGEEMRARETRFKKKVLEILKGVYR